MRLFLILIMCLSAWSVAAQDEVRAARAIAGFEAWLEAHGAGGALALRRAGRTGVVHEAGLPAQEKGELASVGKAVTAICAAQLVARGVLEWGDTLGDLVGRGPDISLAELVTQSSGLRSDATQQIMIESYGDDVVHRSADVLDAVIARDGPRRPPGKHRYTNENYALAALMIEAATDRPYEAVCRETAIDPTGVSAGVSKASAVSLPWGGWTMTPQDAAIWHGYWFGAEQATGRTPMAFPAAVLPGGGSAHYGLGTYFRALEPGNTFWHFGALCFPGRHERGAYAVTWFGDWTAVALYDACVDWDAMAELDQTLSWAILGPLD